MYTNGTNASKDADFQKESGPKVKQVTEIPPQPVRGQVYSIESPNGHPIYTHYLFRFPAKFHPPVVSWALDAFGRKGSAVLDPFTGSGTLQVEALVREMPSVGIDIDPLACFVAQVKTTPLDPGELQRALVKIETILKPGQRSDTEIENLRGSDISDEQFNRQIEGLAYPRIPNIFHWFKRHVVVDLARVFGAIQEAGLGKQQTAFFRACAAASIRRVSNADPTPVSGLEVTRVQAELNKQREIRVFDEFISRARKGIEGIRSLWDACGKKEFTVPTRVLHGDMLRAKELLANEGLTERFPLVVTSPPYCTAVNYSRRHKLEMYWLGFIEDRDQQLELAHSYIGRRRVRIPDWNQCDDFGIRDLDCTLAQVTEINSSTGRALRHYFWSISSAIAQLHQIISTRGVFICAIGDSVSRGVPIRTTQFVKELAAQHFLLRNHFSYTVQNHYMQYPLRNHDGIREESILVLERR